MAAVARRPLALRTQPVHYEPALSPLSMKNNATAKRPRSPDGNDLLSKPVATKRTKFLAVTPEEQVNEKEAKKAERDALKEEFRIKYTKAFPSWNFFFDTSDAERDRLAARVTQLNARVAKFFSNEVTHVITKHHITDADSNKENAPKAKPTTPLKISVLKSPIKLKGRVMEETGANNSDALVKKAKSLGMKIWDAGKLDSVLIRCLIPPLEILPSTKPPTRSLTSLLESERRYGTTSERDPAEKRHDFHYFSKNSYFVLVEDMHQELATIAALEYPITRASDGKEKGQWPVPYCHPLARCPFIEYNEKEERRRERAERAEKEREEERERALEIKKRKLQQQKQKPPADLRRSVSMSNLHREEAKAQSTLPGESIDDCDGEQGASGYLASNYMAASGNSVGITSTYGTTSTAGSSLLAAQAQLPPALRGKEVLTSRKVSTADKENQKPSIPSTLMPPPASIPNKRKGLLRKCKSTNTMKLPKRDEASKPGYCESCRIKFEDFKQHVKGKKHLKFAMTEGNFFELDFVLSRAKRKSMEEVAREQAEWEARSLQSSETQYIDLDDDDDDPGDQERLDASRSYDEETKDDEEQVAQAIVSESLYNDEEMGV
ncbi:hypothetical protein BD410DRAFT_770181 [Rickenella mellea]|uniref:DBF4-type domain-containing protein n=1 Tax=Rickenella mellea TaxID=50990 RepID=A0A4Y7Q6W1_9AGAM|nr:hypothetical protein BD410DRAFT_770181 [Rickenella mellea]